MRTRLLLITILTAILAGCGSSDRYAPLASIEECLDEAGTAKATRNDQLDFAERENLVPYISRRDRSNVLNLGAYRGAADAGDSWRIYYVVGRKFEVALPVLLSIPDTTNAAKVVAYLHPADPQAVRAADACFLNVAR